MGKTAALAKSAAALAKGARRPKGPFESALDLLAICRVVFLHKSSDTLDLLTEAKLEKRFRASTRDLSRLYAGYYVAELLNELTDIADPHPELFEAAIFTLAELNAEGLLAICIQHEMDHLEGKLFVDYLSDLKRDRLKKKLTKTAKRGSGQEDAATISAPVI